MDIKDAIKARRSVRSFSDKKVEISIVKELIEAASWAPSSCNKQAWKFIIVDDKKKKQAMVDMGGASIIKLAPMGILVVYSKQSDNTEYMDYVQSASASIQNILLTAHAKGLACCWVCHLPRKKDLQRLFSIHSSYSPIGYILLGYPNKASRLIERRYNVDDLISFNKFDFSDKLLLEKDKSVLFKKIIRKLYYLMPTSLKKIINPLIDKKFVKKFEN